jgi:hypothetical protein
VAKSNAVIDFRAQTSQRELIDRAAAVQGKKRTEFMLEAACAKATEVLLWGGLHTALRTELASSGQSRQDFLKSRQAWNLVGRVHFNLAENRKDAQPPFAFMATYTARLSAHGQGRSVFSIRLDPDEGRWRHLPEATG